MNIKAVEDVDGYTVLEMSMWGFEKLSLKEKMLIYHLWHACVAGDRISYEQNYKYALELRDLFLDILEYEDYIPSEVYKNILSYAKNIITHHGIHDSRSTAKFMPKFSAEELREAVKIAHEHGFRHKLTTDIERAMFEPDVDVMLTQKNPTKGDIITESKNTFYHDVTLKDVESFEDKYPLNSTLVKEEGKLVEKVWRAGNAKVPAGQYAKELKETVRHLSNAKEYADEPYRKILDMLIGYFETGDPKLFDDYNIAWLKADEKVDTIIGFIEQYLDARGCKGSYEGVVFFRDEESNRIVRAIADSAQYLEDRAPWDNRYKKKWNHIPIATAVMQVIGTGTAGPTCFAGVNLPNPQWIREKYNSRNFYIANITYASRTAFTDVLWSEFIENPEDKILVEGAFHARGPVHVTLHEVIGHGSGKVNPELKGDPKDYLREYYSTLEETRAESCALYFMWDTKLISEGILSEQDAKAGYLAYAVEYMTHLARCDGEEMIHADHERARSIIIRYLLEKGSCIFYKKDGKTYPKIMDYGLARVHVGELLSDIMRIKAEGDYDACKSLVEKYGIYFDKGLRDEIVRRAKKAEYPSNFAYVMCYPELVKDDSGKTIDVILKHYPSMIAQGMAIRKISG